MGQGDETSEGSTKRFTLHVGGLELVVLSCSEETAAALPPSLTAAERSVAELLLQGLSTPRIAALRGSRPRTVANQIAAIFRKAGVSSRAELSAHTSAASSSLGSS